MLECNKKRIVQRKKSFLLRYARINFEQAPSSFTFSAACMPRWARVARTEGMVEKLEMRTRKKKKKRWARARAIVHTRLLGVNKLNCKKACASVISYWKD